MELSHQVTAYNPHALGLCNVILSPEKSLMKIWKLHETPWKSLAETIRSRVERLRHQSRQQKACSNPSEIARNQRVSNGNSWKIR